MTRTKHKITLEQSGNNYSYNEILVWVNDKLLFCEATVSFRANKWRYTVKLPTGHHVDVYTKDDIKCLAAALCSAAQDQALRDAVGRSSQC